MLPKQVVRYMTVPLQATEVGAHKVVSQFILEGKVYVDTFLPGRISCRILSSGGGPFAHVLFPPASAG